MSKEKKKRKEEKEGEEEEMKRPLTGDGGYIDR